MNQAAETPADRVARKAEGIIQARRRSPRPQADTDANSSEFAAIPIRRDATEDVVPRPDDATALDERAALNEWLKSVESELSVLHGELAPVVRDVINAYEADQLWDLLTVIEETVEQHILNPGDSAFRRLGGDDPSPQIKAIRNILLPALLAVARPLRTYRLVSQKLERRGDDLTAHDYLMTHRELSTDSDEVTAKVGELRSAVAKAGTKIREQTKLR